MSKDTETSESRYVTSFVALDTPAKQSKRAFVKSWNAREMLDEKEFVPSDYS